MGAAPAFPSSSRLRISGPKLRPHAVRPPAIAIAPPPHKRSLWGPRSRWSLRSRLRLPATRGPRNALFAFWGGTDARSARGISKLPRNVCRLACSVPSLRTVRGDPCVRRSGDLRHEQRHKFSELCNYAAPARRVARQRPAATAAASMATTAATVATGCSVRRANARDPKRSASHTSM